MFNKSKNKILYYYVLSGNDASHFNSYLSIYKESGVKLGKFYIGSTGMPEIKGNDLIFNEPSGDCNQTTAISFRDHIPKEIFINCTKRDGQMNGDLYTFETQQE